MKKELLEFIRKAKLNGYASENSVWENTDSGGKTTRFEEGNFVYTDTYFGNMVDCGQELAYENGKVVWMMSYRGGAVRGKEDFAEQGFSVLKKCISQMPNDFPVRGPKKIEESNLTYENNWDGDIEDFVGEENIYLNGEKICFRNYFGGIVRSK
jgi:hypothetical protein